MAACSVSAVYAATGAGLVDADPGQFGKEGLELLPDPLRDDFAGGVFQARDFVQVVVIKLLIQWFEDGFYFRKITNPAGIRIDLAFDINGNAEGVAM